MLCTSNRTTRHSCFRRFLTLKEPAICDSSKTTKRCKSQRNTNDDHPNRAEELFADEENLSRMTQRPSVAMKKDSAANTSLMLCRIEEREREKERDREREREPRTAADERRSRKGGRFSLEDVDPKSKGRENPEGRRSLPTALDGPIKHDPRILSVSSTDSSDSDHPSHDDCNRRRWNTSHPLGRTSLSSRVQPKTIDRGTVSNLTHSEGAVLFRTSIGRVAVGETFAEIQVANGVNAHGKVRAEVVDVLGKFSGMKLNRSEMISEVTKRSNLDSSDEQRIAVTRNSLQFRDNIIADRSGSRRTVSAKSLLRRATEEDLLAPTQRDFIRRLSGRLSPTNQSTNFPISFDRDFEAKNSNTSPKRSKGIPSNSRHRRRPRNEWRHEVFNGEDLVNALIGNKYRNCRRWVMTYVNNMLASGRLQRVGGEEGGYARDFSSFDFYSFGQQTPQLNEDDDSCCRTLAIC